VGGTRQLDVGGLLRLSGARRIGSHATYPFGVAQTGNTERLRRLQLVTDAALAHLDLEELLAELLGRIREALEADTVAVLLRDDEHEELVARAAVGLEREVEEGVRIPIGKGFAGRIAAENSPVILEDVDHADVLNPILREEGVKSLLGVPLVFANEVIGVLHVGTLRPRKFTPDDVELLELVANRMSIAVEHARLFGAERDARERLERVQTVTDVALSALSLDELMPEVLTRIRDLLGADTAAILMVDEETQELVARAAVGIEEEVEQGVRIPIGGGFAGRVAATRRPIRLDDVDHADVLNPLLREKGIKSLLGVPLIVQDEVLGVLHVGTLVPRIFTRYDEELLELVASRVGLAIERARIQDETARLDELKLNFVAVASHELRTPATAVYGITETLRHHGDTLPAETRHELEETLWEQATRLRRLIEQLLDLSRLDASAIVIEPQTFELGALVRQVAAGFEPAGEVQIEIPDDLRVHADKLAFEQIFSNLIGNAFRYGEPPVVVTAHTPDTYLRVSVEDEGSGVPAGLVPKLFERFERGAVGDGSGLGLSIAQAYARAHGGDLIYDRGRNGGARFDLILPRSAS
jgi:K+-sensing histidine kinase KdpD